MGDKGLILVADALIRSELHIDPSTLTDDEWAVQFRLAEYILNHKCMLIGRALGVSYS